MLPLVEISSPAGHEPFPGTAIITGPTKEEAESLDREVRTSEGGGLACGHGGQPLEALGH